MDNKKMIEIKNTILYFYNEFLNETRNTDVAIKLTKEAMTTYRTYLMQDEQSPSKITESQLQFLEWKQGDFEVNKIIMEELKKFGKSNIEDLTKNEAYKIISKIKGGE